MMPSNEVFMDYPKVEELSRKFQTFADLTDKVSKAFEAVAFALRLNAFIGQVGGAAVLCYLEKVQPDLKVLSEKLREIAQDLMDAVKFMRDGDTTGSQKFVN